MGWDIIQKRPQNPKEYLDAEFTTDRCEVVESAMPSRGQYYAAVRSKKDGHVFAAVVICQTHRDGTWAYKTMTETMEPYYYRCPARILKHLSPTTSEYALRWREMCSAPKTRTNLETGDVITLSRPAHFRNWGDESVFIVHKMGRATYFKRKTDGVLCRISGWKNLEFTVDKPSSIE